MVSLQNIFLRRLCGRLYIFITKRDVFAKYVPLSFVQLPLTKCALFAEHVLSSSVWLLIIKCAVSTEHVLLLFVQLLMCFCRTYSFVVCVVAYTFYDEMPCLCRICSFAEHVPASFVWLPIIKCGVFAEHVPLLFVWLPIVECSVFPGSVLLLFFTMMIRTLVSGASHSNGTDHLDKEFNRTRKGPYAPK